MQPLRKGFTVNRDARFVLFKCMLGNVKILGNMESNEFAVDFRDFDLLCSRLVPTYRFEVSESGKRGSGLASNALRLKIISRQ